ncbi:hypothetical protein F2P45_30825 [Massilia sp. CCM 8733]|uniref:Uncharacterized protein n=1 Tax=Massilia mucilaginosa TaxID=2609282 RepID=A0ABX0P2B3_9BURK|nr:hypothetical protein [Massilia mucilaginosa]NHZ93370.1 hypothetical protein [Massilia mucilaginosa]
MSTLEDSIGIDDASEGMVLACDLRDAGGAVLLPAGATLGAAALASLRRRGIERLQVVGAVDPDASSADDALDAAARQAERERQCARLQHLFRRCMNGSAGGAGGASAVLFERLLAYRGSA